MAFCYAVMIVHGIAECSLYYVALIARNLDDSIHGELFDQDGHLSETKSEEVCVDLHVVSCSVILFN